MSRRRRDARARGIFAIESLKGLQHAIHRHDEDVALDLCGQRMEMVPLAPSYVAGGGAGGGHGQLFGRVHFWNRYEGVVHVLTAGM